MELNIFKESLLSYYKKHDSEYVQNLTIDYIESTYPVKSLEHLMLAVLKSHPYKYGFPDVSAIETAANRFEISEKVLLKKKIEKKDYNSSPIEKLTEEERIESDQGGHRDKWNDLVKKMANRAKDIDPDKLDEIKDDLKQE